MARRLFAEWLGTLFLLAVVVGSGIMADRLAGGNVAIALLGNTISTKHISAVGSATGFCYSFRPDHRNSLPA